MRLTQEEMTAQPEESFLPLDPYFMGTVFLYMELDIISSLQFTVYFFRLLFHQYAFIIVAHLKLNDVTFSM